MTLAAHFFAAGIKRFESSKERVSDLKTPEALTVPEILGIKQIAPRMNRSRDNQ
jgi:hypothetical protein